MPTPLSKLPNTMKAVLAGAMGAAMFGAEIGYWGVANSMKSFNLIMKGNIEEELSSNEVSLISASLYISATIFALPPISERILGVMGRRKILMISGLLFAVAYTLQGIAANISYPASKAVMYTGRVLLGIPVAWSVLNSPAFLTEIAPAAHRGFIGGMFQFTLMLFLVLSNGVGWAINTYHKNCPDCFQWTVWYLVVLGLIVAVVMYFSNDTPQFHLINGNEKEAENILFHLREGGDEKETQKEFELMKTDIAAEKKALGEFSNKSLFQGFPLRILLIALFNQFLNQWVGMNFFNAFAPRIYGKFLPDMADMLSFVSQILQTIGAMVSAVLTNRFGRRPLLMIGGATLVLAWGTMALLGDTVIHIPAGRCQKITACPTIGNYTCDMLDLDDAVFASKEMAFESICGIDYNATACDLTVGISDALNLNCIYTGDEANAPTASNPHPHFDIKYAYAMVGLAMSIFFIYGATAGPITWTYNAEIAPANIRTQILGYAAACNLFFNGTMVYLPNIMVVYIGFNAFWIFVAICAVGVGFWYWLVETNGLPLEVVTQKWEEKLNCKYTDIHITDIDTDSSNNDEGEEMA